MGTHEVENQPPPLVDWNLSDTPAVKYWVTKRTPALVAEAMEVLGGNGYVEESILPRLYREAPLNSIWEGSGNVMCLDVLRAMARRSDALDALRAELGAGAGADRRLDGNLAALEADLPGGGGADPSHDPEVIERGARRLVERLVLALQGALLVRHAPSAVADAFCASRLAGDRGGAFGTLPAGVDLGAIIARATPRVS